MIALVQRVKRAAVRVDGQTVGVIDSGMLILLGVHRLDTDAELEWVARKCANLRIFPDDEGKMNRSVIDVSGDALVVSQFTLYGSVERGNRPSFVDSAPPEHAEPMYNRFVSVLAGHLGRPVATGQFGAMMDVDFINDGPVTLSVEKVPGS